MRQDDTKVILAPKPKKYHKVKIINKYCNTMLCLFFFDDLSNFKKALVKMISDEMLHIKV